MPLILPGNVASATAAVGYDVANSCRFSDPGTSYIHKTPGSAGDQTEYTFSCWVKRGMLVAGSGTNQSLLESGTGGSNYSSIGFYHSGSASTNGALDWHSYNSGYAYRLRTTRKFLDCSAWYHFVFAFDSDQGTDANKMKLWVNGVQETSFLYDTYPSAQDAYINADDQHAIGYDVHQTTNYYLDGYLAEVCFIDGQQLDADQFGEFDSDSPTIWKPKDVSGLTFGSNGTYLDFEDSGNLGDDESGNTNDWTEVNLAAADQATDTPTNNFCTLNPLDNFFAGGTVSEGNCKYLTASSPYGFIQSTFNVSSGKWFWEVKNIDGTATMIGASGATGSAGDSNTHGAGFPLAACAYHIDGRKIIGNVLSSYGDAYTDDDIIGVALNLDDDEIKFYKNGTVQNSGTAISIVAAASAPNGGYSPAISEESNDSTQTLECNFGGCSAFTVSSANQDANGYGNFEYAVPSGFFALCTKNLAEYG